MNRPILTACCIGLIFAYLESFVVAHPPRGISVECLILCPSGEMCVNDYKDQYKCVPNPCDRMDCKSGYRCEVRQRCWRSRCRPVGSCVPDQGQNGNGSCPPIQEIRLQVCNVEDFEDCRKSGCVEGLLCCPNSCGGTSCQKPYNSTSE